MYRVPRGQRLSFLLTNRVSMCNMMCSSKRSINTFFRDSACVCHNAFFCTCIIADSLKRSTYIYNRVCEPLARNSFERDNYVYGNRLPVLVTCIINNKTGIYVCVWILSNKSYCHPTQNILPRSVFGLFQ
jgi:hypothetical protein